MSPLKDRKLPDGRVISRQGFDIRDSKSRIYCTIKEPYYSMIERRAASRTQFALSENCNANAHTVQSEARTLLAVGLVVHEAREALSYMIVSRAGGYENCISALIVFGRSVDCIKLVDAIAFADYKKVRRLLWLGQGSLGKQNVDLTTLTLAEMVEDASIKYQQTPAAMARFFICEALDLLRDDILLEIVKAEAEGG